MLGFWTPSIGLSAVILGGLKPMNANFAALLTLGAEVFFSFYVLYLD